MSVQERERPEEAMVNRGQFRAGFCKGKSSSSFNLDRGHRHLRVRVGANRQALLSL